MSIASTRAQPVGLLAAANEAGVWYGTAEQGMGLRGWLVLAGVVTAVAGLCWLANWAVNRRVSGVEAASRHRGSIDRLVDGILQTFRQ